MFSHWIWFSPESHLGKGVWARAQTVYRNGSLHICSGGCSSVAAWSGCAWQTQCLCCEATTRWPVFTSLDNWDSCSSYISGLRLVQGSPLLTSEALFLLFRVTSFGTRILKSRGLKKLNQKDSLSTSVSRSDSLGQVWFLLSGPIYWKACFCFLVFLEFIQM